MYFYKEIRIVYMTKTKTKTSGQLGGKNKYSEKITDIRDVFSIFSMIRINMQ